MGYAAAIAVVVAVLAAVTLLPALLGALGLRIHALRVHLGRTHPDDHQPHGWARWARGVVARPWRSLLASVVILVVLAVPVLDLHLGSSDNGELPKDTTARRAYDLISEGFGPGANGPLLVGVTLGTPAKPVQAQESPATDPRLTKLEGAIGKDPGIQSVSPATVDPAGTAAVFTAIPKTAPSDRATEDLVKRLRADVIPQATEGSDVEANVGGQTAAYIDLADRISDKLPQMIAIVVGLSCIVLLLAFRSILLPVKAAVANLLSVAAAYGVVTFVFQEGHGASLLGLDDRTRRDLYRAGLLHDIGKLGVSNRILDKRGGLDADEWREVRKHPLTSLQILRRVGALGNVARISGLHHERLDGSGYYLGFDGTQLDLPARVLAVADVAEALSAHRPYRDALGPDEVLEIMAREAGTTLDAEAFEALVELMTKPRPARQVA